MKKSGLLLLLIVGMLHFLSAQNASRQILKKLDKQIECWNKGDLECFMETYQQSDSLMFIGKNGITYGWQNVLDNYRKSYPDRLAMGNLQFEILKIKSVSRDNYFVVGKWLLTRAAGKLKGHFSLLWQKIGDDWYIVADHSRGTQ